MKAGNDVFLQGCLPFVEVFGISTQACRFFGQTVLRFVLLRCDCSGDLCHHVCFSNHGQVHLHQEGDVSKPRSEICAEGRQLRVPVQRPGRFSGCSQWKPKGVFYLAVALNELKRQNKMNYQTVLYLFPLFSSGLFFFSFVGKYYRLEMRWTFKRHWCCHFKDSHI